MGNSSARTTPLRALSRDSQSGTLQQIPHSSLEKWLGDALEGCFVGCVTDYFAFLVEHIRDEQKTFRPFDIGDFVRDRSLEPDLFGIATIEWEFLQLGTNQGNSTLANLLDITPAGAIHSQLRFFGSYVVSFQRAPPGQSDHDGYLLIKYEHAQGKRAPRVPILVYPHQPDWEKTIADHCHMYPFTESHRDHSLVGTLVDRFHRDFKRPDLRAMSRKIVQLLETTSYQQSVRNCWWFAKECINSLGLTLRSPLMFPGALEMYMQAIRESPQKVDPTFHPLPSESDDSNLAFLLVLYRYKHDSGHHVLDEFKRVAHRFIRHHEEDFSRYSEFFRMREWEPTYFPVWPPKR